MLWGAAALFIGVGGATWAAVGAVRRRLLRHDILDHPNPRSSHTVAMPRGGGIGVLAVLLPLWLIVALAPGEAGSASWLLAPIALGLGVISWRDDVRGLGAWTRLAAQGVAVALGMAALPGTVFQGLLPEPLDRLAAGVLWLWFINLFNFMDGIDGISGVETSALGLGLFVIGLVGGTLQPMHWQALIVAGAALGFLAWNWQPARIFLGDVGSVPVGFLLGWLLLSAAAAGAWPAALILPLYYLADSGLTLLRRLMRRENILRAHREHFYQLAVRRGCSHGQVALAVAAVNVLLILHAVITVAAGGRPAGPVVAGGAIVSAAAFVVGLLFWLAGKGPAGADTNTQSN